MVSLFGGHTLDTALTADDLIPGNPDALDTTIAGLIALGVSGQDAGSGMTRLCTGEGWTGAAAEGFRAAFQMEPGRWSSLGQALTDAGHGLKQYRDAVHAAQGEARVAMEEWRHAQQATAIAAVSFQRVRDAYEAAGLLGQQAGPPPTFTDPGAAGRAAAEARLAAARTRVAEAGLAAMRVLADARDALPAEPGVWTRFGEGFVDTFSTFGTQAADFAGGALDTTISMVGSVEKMNATSGYNITHPQEYQHRLDEAGQVVANVVEHPVTTMQSMVDSAKQAWSHDPGRAAGSLVPAVVLGVATGGAGDAAAAGTELADTAASELETVAQAAGQDTIAAADTASGTGGGVADSSVNATPRWGSWDFGPTGGDAQAAGEIQDSGAGLAKAEHDLSGVHVHLDPAAPTQNPVTTGAGDAARLETPAHSVSRSTQWGTFGGWDQPAAAVAGDSTAAGVLDQTGPGLSQVERDLSQIHVTPPSVVSGVDAAAAARIDAAGTGLGQVERDLAGIHVNPQAGADSSFSGNFSADQVPGYLNPEYKAGDVARQAYRDKWRTTAQDRAWLDDVRRGWPRAARMTDQELLAVERYLSPDGALMNTALHTGDQAALAELEPELLNLTSALNKLPNYQGIVSRGLDVKTSDLGDFLLRYEPGTTIREPGFTTTSTHQPGRGNVAIYVNATHGKDISTLMSGQNQVLFPAGEAFQVTQREFDPMTKMWTIYLDDMGR
jgi:hypothetical protein